MTVQEMEQTKAPELSEVLSAVISYVLAGLHTVQPGVIEKWDPKAQVADVQPLLKRTIIFEDGETEEEGLPLLKSVPVILGPRSSNYFMSIELNKGDNVLLIMNERSIDEYFATSNGRTQITPKDLRHHDLNDAVALPGSFPKSLALSDDISKGATFGKLHGAQVRVRDALVEITSNGATASMGGFVALAQLVASELSKIQTALNTHVHSGVTTGPGTSGTAAPVYIPAAVASTNLKAD